jgi:hypothetical protein
VLNWQPDQREECYGRNQRPEQSKGELGSSNLDDSKLHQLIFIGSFCGTLTAELAVNVSVVGKLNGTCYLVGPAPT